MTDANRPLPHTDYAEGAVLGSMILDPTCIGGVVEILREEDFFQEEHRTLWRAIVGLWEDVDKELDGILVRHKLEESNALAAIGGTEYLRRVVESVASSGGVKHYAGIVKADAKRRKLLALAEDITTAAYDPSADIPGVLDDAENRLVEMADGELVLGAQPVGDLVTAAFEAIEKRDGSILSGIPTGYSALDLKLGGLQDGYMIVIAGRPSMGKTALALNIAEYAAMHERVPVMVFSLEMTREKLMDRLLSSVSGLSSNLLRMGLGKEGDPGRRERYERLVVASEQLRGVPLMFDDNADLTPMQLRARARRFAQRYGIRLMILDYLQLMSTHRKVESRQVEVAGISRTCKALAKELHLPFVVLSQLNRASEGRTHHKPRMSDLRESGTIEQDADVVMLIHREDYYHKDEPAWPKSNTANIMIEKHRDGETGNAELLWRGEVMRFENLAQSPADGEVPF